MRRLRCKGKPRSLRVKILMTTLLIAALAITGSFAMLYSQSMTTLMNQYQQTTMLMLEQTQTRLDSVISQVESEMLSLQMNVDFPSILSDSVQSKMDLLHARRDFLTDMRTLISSNANISAVLIVEESGTVWGTSSIRTMSQDKSDLWALHYSEIIGASHTSWLGGFLDTDFMLLPESEFYNPDSTPVLLCARRINSMMPRRSMLVVAIPTNRLASVFAECSLPSENLCIIDRNGRYVYGTDQGLVNAYIAESAGRSSSLNTTIQGIDMHLITLPLRSGLRLVCSVPMSYYHAQMHPTLVYMLLIGVIALLVISVGCIAAAVSLQRPLRGMVQVTERVSSGDLSARMDENSSVTEYIKLSQTFNTMLENLSSLMNRNMQIEREKRQAEIEALQAQINPHFLFNTITSLRWIAVMTQADSISNALTCLSKLMRPLFYSPSNHWSLREECDYIQNYIYLMEMRFGSQITFSMDTQDNALGRTVPRFTLQPILENSYEHAGRSRCMNIRLSVVLDRLDTLITISDDGCGMDRDALDQLRAAMFRSKRIASRSGSIGLANVYHRLKLFYGDNMEMDLHSEAGKGFTVTIRLMGPPVEHN